MASVVVISNYKGDILIYRRFRDDISRQEVLHFLDTVIAPKKASSPCMFLNGSTFMHCGISDINLVAASKSDVNCMLVLTFLRQFIDLLRAYFEGNTVTDALVRENFSLVYELLDEVVDYGIPQLMDPDLLKEYIRTGKQAKQLTDLEKLKQITVRATGAVSWRPEGIKHKRNEIYIDIIESINLSLSTRGTVLKAEVLGKIACRTALTGMPECRFGVNDKLQMASQSKESSTVAAAEKSGVVDTGIALEDIKFHQCVRLGKFDRDRSITFIPPDGNFEIMSYRISENINLPFKIVPVIQEYPELCKMEISIRLRAIFEPQSFANNVMLKIQLPMTTSNVRIFSSGQGKAKFEPHTNNSIVWRFAKFQGESEALLTADVQLLPSKSGKLQWQRAPISVDFSIPMFTASGLRVRFCKVIEKSGYKPVKWIRYVSKAGEYEHKL